MEIFLFAIMSAPKTLLPCQTDSVDQKQRGWLLAVVLSINIHAEKVRSTNIIGERSNDAITTGSSSLANISPSFNVRSLKSTSSLIESPCRRKRRQEGF